MADDEWTEIKATDYEELRKRRIQQEVNFEERRTFNEEWKYIQNMGMVTVTTIGTSTINGSSKILLCTNYKHR